MHYVRTLIALTIATGLGLAPMPSWPQSKPDSYVSIGAPTKETTVAKGTIEKVVVTIGNQTDVPPLGVNYTAIMTVLTPSSQAVCEINAGFATLLPNSSLNVFQFQVAHPSPITQPVAKGTAPSASHPGGSINLPVGRTQEYHVHARLIASGPAGVCPQVDSNCTNNQAFRAIQVPLGGTPTCTKLP
jgi:hypothetical protein